MAADANGPLVWIDLEMTGLEPETCTILEIASIVSDSDLNVIAEGPDLVIHLSDTELATMSPWCIEHHGGSGLTQASRESSLTLREAEAQTLEFLRQHTSAGVSPLCGNSIGLDWRFIQAHMPELAAFLTGELIDVTTIKELGKRWYPKAEKLTKAGGHRALADIQESILELALYKKTIFR
ncbi:MAG: oligoribonuclease [Sandaracinaceae bacterium]|nr:oligoribonuclease [Sandaracinaceae bacterium]